MACRRARTARSVIPLAAACGVLLAAPAAGQNVERPTDAVREEAKFHVGPFYVSPRLTLRQMGIDNNVFNQAAAEQKSDFTFTLQPSTGVAVPLGSRAVLRTVLGADLVYFARYHSERSIDPQLSFRAEAYLHRITLFASESTVRTRQRPNEEIDVRSRRDERVTLAGADVRLTPKFSVELAGRREIREYDAGAFAAGNSLRDALNRTATAVSITPRHRLTPLTTIAVRADAMREEFLFAPGRNADSVRISPGVEFKPRALVSGQAFIGYRRLTPHTVAVLPPFSGLISTLGLTYRSRGTVAFGITFDRDIRYSLEPYQPYFLDTTVGGSARRALGRRFDLTGTVQRHTYEYENVLIVPVGETLPAARVDRTMSYSASVGYRFGSDGRIGFGATWYDRESSRQAHSYESVRLGADLTYGF